jgi:quercetin 2,3-dioxygenase
MATRTPAPAVDVRRAGDRPATRLAWLDSKHSFSFGPHWDPADAHHGLLLVNNDDVVLPGPRRAPPLRPDVGAAR